MDATLEDVNFSKDLASFFEVALQESTPDIAEKLKAGLKKRYDKPPLEEMTLCLDRHVPLSKARQLLFNPAEEDMRLYPLLIAMPPPGAPDSHPQHQVQVCALASLYLVHSKRWELVRPFVEAGGLRQLAVALAHPSPYLASQAMSALMHITDEGLVFPWHEPPPTPDGRGPRQGPYALVWQNMFDLNRGGVFLTNLLAHYRRPPVFPGGPGMALRLFAFYVSWLRRHWTQDRRLSLSASLLEMLQRWAADPQATEEELKLAEALHKDFSRFPPAQGPSPAAGGGPSQHHLGGLSAEDEPATTVVSERTEINSGASSATDNEAEALKEQGNEAYKRGDFCAAIRLYSDALDVLVPQEMLLTEGPRRAAYHANRAAAYMARAASGMLREGDADTTGHLEGVDHGSAGIVSRHYQAVIIDCDVALDLQPAGRMAVKTLLRKSRALLQLGHREEAAAAAQSGLDKCDNDDTEEGLRAELKAALRMAQQKQGQRQGTAQEQRQVQKQATRAQVMATAAKPQESKAVPKPEVIDVAPKPNIDAAPKPEAAASVREVEVQVSKPDSKPAAKVQEPQPEPAASKPEAEVQELNPAAAAPEREVTSDGQKPGAAASKPDTKAARMEPAGEASVRVTVGAQSTAATVVTAVGIVSDRHRHGNIGGGAGTSVDWDAMD